MEPEKENKKTNEKRRKAHLKNKLTHNRKEGLSDGGSSAKQKPSPSDWTG